MTEPSGQAERAEQEYDTADAEYMLLVPNADQITLMEAATRARNAARQWQKLAYEEFFAARDIYGDTDRSVIVLEIEAEKAEVLTSLWTDLAFAHSPR